MPAIAAGIILAVLGLSTLMLLGAQNAQEEVVILGIIGGGIILSVLGFLMWSELKTVNINLKNIGEMLQDEIIRQKKEEERALSLAKSRARSDSRKELRRRFEEDMDRSLKEGSLKLEETAEGQVYSGKVVCGVCRESYDVWQGSLGGGCPHC